MAKIKISFKCPDAVEAAIEDQLHDVENRYLDEVGKDTADDLTDEEAEHLEELIEAAKEVLEEAVGKWFQYREYCTVELDPDADTCTVVRPT
jgi:HEPN domain-containing protein